MFAACGYTSLLSKLFSNLIFLVGSAILHSSIVDMVVVMYMHILLEKVLPLSATFLGGSIKCQLFVMLLTRCTLEGLLKISKLLFCRNF